MAIIRSVICLFILVVICAFFISPNTVEESRTEKNVEDSISFFIQKRVFLNEVCGDSATAVFEYYNYTDRLMLIEGVRKRCHCITVGYSKKPIMPKERGSINVVIDVSFIEGRFTKSILVYLKNHKPVVLTVVGTKVK